MTSGQENQSGNYIRTPVTLSEVSANLKDADSILDFVRANTKSADTIITDTLSQASAAQNSQQPASAGTSSSSAAPAVAIAAKPETADATGQVGGAVGESASEKSVETSKFMSENPDQHTDAAKEGADESLVVELKGSAAENFKNLRQVVKETKVAAADKDVKIRELETELDEYKRGARISEDLQKRETRIAELEQYEKIVNLKASPQYQEHFVKPHNKLLAQLEQAAKEYDVDPKDLSNLVNVQNNADVNRWLSRYFDDIGAIEVKQTLQKIKDLRQQAFEAEQEPDKVMQNIMQQANNARLAQLKENREVMQTMSRDAWLSAITKIQKDGNIRELMYRPGDDAYNNKHIKPLIEAAATEYGKLVTQLAQNGLEKLTPETAQAVARMCLLAHASAVSSAITDRAIKYATNVEQNAARTASYIRPSANGGGSGEVAVHAGVGALGGPNSPAEAGEALLRQIGRGKY